MRGRSGFPLDRIAQTGQAEFRHHVAAFRSSNPGDQIEEFLPDALLSVPILVVVVVMTMVALPPRRLQNGLDHLWGGGGGFLHGPLDDLVELAAV